MRALNDANLLQLLPVVRLHDHLGLALRDPPTADFVKVVGGGEANAAAFRVLLRRRVLDDRLRLVLAAERAPDLALTLPFERNFCLAPWVRATSHATKVSRNLGGKKRNYETKFGGLLHETLVKGN